jgi:hypothetical protein
MSGAALGYRDTGEGLLHVLTAPAPRHFAALPARRLITHDVSFDGCAGQHK